MTPAARPVRTEVIMPKQSVAKRARAKEGASPTILAFDKRQRLPKWVEPPRSYPSLLPAVVSGRPYSVLVCDEEAEAMELRAVQDEIAAFARRFPSARKG